MKLNENKPRNKWDGSPHPTKTWLPWVLWSAHFRVDGLCCKNIFKNNKLFETEHKSLCTNETHVRGFSMTKIFTNRFGLLRLILILVTKHWNLLTIVYWVTVNFEPCKKVKGKGKGAYLVGCYQYIQSQLFCELVLRGAVVGCCRGDVYIESLFPICTDKVATVDTWNKI